MTDDDDEVGYKKPPRQHRFKKGQSGNPTGRRARSKSFDALVERQLDKKVAVTVGGRKVKVALRQAVLMKVASDALNGRTRAQEFYLKYMQASDKPDHFAAKPYDHQILSEIAATLVPSGDDEPEGSVMAASTYERLYRADLPAFARFAFHELSPRQDHALGWHVDVMADALQGCLERGTSRLIINAPPRSLKSHCASVAFVVFALGHDPTRKVIIVAGTRALAAELQRRALALMRTPRCRALFPHLRPTETSNEIVLPHGGGILYAVVGQSLVGRGADIVVMDDAIAPHRAQDDAEREAVNAYYDAEIVPRLNDKAGGVVVLVMQRVHLDDLTAHVRERGVWTEVVLPAIALADEAWPLHRRRTVRRRKGELLQPEREGRDTLLGILNEVDAYNFSAQYLQRPLRAPGLYRVGYSHAPRPPDWRPEMGLSGGGFVRVRESTYIRHDVFGVGEPPSRIGGHSPYTDEEWEAAAIIQQRRLVAAAKADALRNGAQGG